MACIDLDFEDSKRFLVFLACANPRVFKNYVKLNPAYFSPIPPALYPDPGHHFSFPPSPEQPGFYEYGYGDYYDEMMPPPPESPEQRYEVNYPTYVTFTPPTSRFPGGPPQLRRSYPPPRPPRPPSPVIVDAAYPPDPSYAGQQANNAPATDGQGETAGNENPIVRDVTPPPNQQTSPPQAQASTNANARSQASRGQRSRQNGAGSNKRQAKGRNSTRRDKTNPSSSKKTSRLCRLSRRRHAKDKRNNSSPSSGSSRTPSQAASSDFYLVDSNNTADTSCHASMFLPKLRARLRAAFRRIHPAEATSSVRNLSHYSGCASLSGLS